MPRPQSVPDLELYDRLAAVFRGSGFAGASLAELAEASGLQRASLYHRFPGGKAQMAEAVLDRVAELFAWAVAPMCQPAPHHPGPGSRVEAAGLVAGIEETARRIGELYGGGAQSCVMDSLSLRGAPDQVRARAAEVAEIWIAAMARAGEQGGREPGVARVAAEDAFNLVEGALVYGRLFGDLTSFERALANLPMLLLGGAVPTAVAGG